MTHRRRRKHARIAAVTVLTAAGLVAGTAVPVAAATTGRTAPATVGAPGLGDPFFPLAGNGGYDVRHYGIALTYRPGTRHLVATTTVDAVATAPLQTFDLDLRGFAVRRLTVNGVGAAWWRSGQELVVRPLRPLPAGHAFTVVVDYDGTPAPVIDPDGSLDGWTPTPDGAFVASEPQGSPSWFPCNDYPTDKALFDISATVPAGMSAIANGDLLSRRTENGWTTWRWHVGQPMPTYLATVTNGRFLVSHGTTPGGVPWLTAVDPSQAAKSAPVLAKLPAIVDFFSRTYGRYPYSSSGAIVDRAPKVGYALETMTRPLFDRAPDTPTLAHELAHQWFGDDVTLATWPQIWLNEGFAEFSAWLWAEHVGGPTAQQTFDRLYGRPASDWIWTPPPGAVRKPVDLFAGSVYERGAMTLQALRTQVGDAAFFRLMRAWVAGHAYGNGTIPQFEALAQRVSGQDLGSFFDTWLRRPGKPALSAAAEPPVTVPMPVPVGRR